MRPSGRGAPIRLPPYAPGQRIGLYGGSFDPPHLGHRHVATVALRRLGLDRVWWLVTPGNPLKTRADLAPRAERLAATQSLARHPRMAVADIEAALGTRYTVDLVRFLRRRCPGVHFVWIMGADGLAGFHRWRAWRAIAALVPLAALDRPGFGLRATSSPAAAALRGARWRESAARRLPLARPPAWLLLHGPRSDLSSTAIRRARTLR